MLGWFPYYTMPVKSIFNGLRVPVRWAFVRDQAGTRRDAYFFTADPTFLPRVFRKQYTRPLPSKAVGRWREGGWIAERAAWVASLRSAYHSLTRRATRRACLWPGSRAVGRVPCWALRQKSSSSPFTS